MKSAVLIEPNRIEIQEHSRLEPGVGEVLIRVRAVGVCGSDTHYFAGWRDHEPSTVYPFVLGHEFAGEVAELGRGVDGVSVGERVLCAPDYPCGGCEWCEKGLENVCENVRFSGSAGVEGCLSEYYIVDQTQLHPIPDNVGFGEATLCEPLAIGLHIIDNLIRPTGGEDYAIIGSGPIGLVSTFSARRRGASKIYVADRIKQRLESALFYGADDVCEVGNGNDFVEYISQQTNGKGTQAVIEAGGEQSSILQAPYLAKIHGKVIIEGIPPEGEQVPFAVDSARRKELTVIFGRRSLHKTDEAVSLLESGEFDTSSIITHEFDLEDTQTALEYCRDYNDGVIKAIIRP